MKDLEIEFDRVFLKYGGSLKLRNHDLPKIDNSVEILHSIIQDLKITKPRLPTPYVSIINSYDVNAVVCKDDGVYYIGLFYGSLLWIYEVFRKMLSNPNILNEVGESANEESIEKITTIQFTNFKHFLDVVNPKIASMPKDPVRAALANYLARNAILFLLLHEYGHITGGHVDSLKMMQANQQFEEKLTNIAENNLPSVENSYLMFRQTCEYDADAWANSILFQFSKSWIEKISAVSPMIKFVFNSYESVVYFHNFSIYAYWRLFGIEYETGRDLLTGTHPPSGIRQRFIMALIGTFFLPFGEDYVKTIVNQCFNSVKDVEEAFNQISEQGNNPLGLKATFGTEHTAHMNNIKANWKIVRPILEPNAFINLAPIEDLDNQASASKIW